MPNFLKTLDGSGRTPRDVQVQALNWLEEGWGKEKIHVILGPVGSGKSLISSTIQRSTGAGVIVISNMLMRQYMSTYQKTNFLMGKAHYMCKMGLTCKDWIDTLDQDPCEGCTYTSCKQKAVDGEATFFNPMSLYYLMAQRGTKLPDTIVVDEAHELSQMILLLCGTRLKKSEYGFDERCVNEIYLTKWIEQTLVRLIRMKTQYYKAGKLEKAVEISDTIESLSVVKKGLEENAQNYAIWMDKSKVRGRMETFLNIKPLKPPRFVVSRILGAKNIVLMSATLSKVDIEELFGEDISHRLLDLPSPIPVENRQVYYRPASFPMNYQTPPQKIAEEIAKIIGENPNVNTLIHTTYALSKTLVDPLKSLLPGQRILFNTETNKDEILAEFRSTGGILLGSGMAEGVDLPGDLCRLNIIPKLLFPNLNDPVVSKRKALPDGQKWLGLKTIMKTIQQTGRSTRNEQDFSKTYILDPNFARLFATHRDTVPKSFAESIVWTKS